jgi:uracil phosphoribosyltransferase
MMAVDVLKSKGVPEDRIIFLNLISSPEGLAKFAGRFPKARIVTSFVDEGLDSKKSVTPTVDQRASLIASSYIVPGLGDFGDRFYTL